MPDYPVPRPVCEHVNLILVRAETSDGRIQVRKQCLRCGVLRGSAIAHASIGRPVDSLPPVNASLSQAWEDKDREWLANRSAWYENIRNGALEQKEEWLNAYKQYLASPQWRAKRAAVMKRAGGVCEGCRSARATQVHHLNYDHAGHVFDGGEFLWELVAICDACHNRIHPREIRAMEVAA